jgi:integrase
MAIDDDIISKNPFKFPLSSVLVDDTVQRKALLPEEEQTLLDYVKTHQKYQRDYNAIYILLNTGVRISELCAITVSDIDFKNHILHINKQLVHLKDKQIRLLSPKTKAGVRDIPISDEVCDCFKREIRARYCRIEPVVDGRTGFVFLTKSGIPITQGYYNTLFKAIRYSYNKEHTNQMPYISPHVCRHTFSSKMAMAGMNVKVLQYIMGHEHVSTTMDIYTHVDFSVVAEEMNRVCTTV